MTSRVDWVDALKGIGIIAVVYVHSNYPASVINDALSNNLLIYINSFYMPLFFFASGIVFDRTRYGKLKDFLLGRVRLRIVPYTCFFALAFFVGALTASVQSDRGVFSVINENWFRLESYAWGTSDKLLNTVGNSPLWFLPCLFVTEIIFYALSMTASAKRLSVLLVALSILAYGESVYITTRIPLSGDTALTAAVFFGAGYLLKDFARTNALQLRTARVKFLWMLLISVNIGLSLLNGGVAMACNAYGKNYVLFYGSAFSGLMAYSLVAMRFAKLKWLVYIGKNSFVIYAFNLFTMNFSVSILNYFNEHAANALYASAVLYNTLIFALSFLLSVPIIFVVNTWLPFLVGKRYASSRPLA